MKYIHNRLKYINEKSNWVDKKKATWEQDFSKLMMSYNQSILDMVEELKDKFNDKDDPIEIKSVYLDFIEKSFENLMSEIRLVSDDINLQKFWREFVLNNILWKDSFKKLSEKMDNYNAIFKLGNELFRKITKYTTKKISTDYYDLLKDGELDDKRERVVNFIEEYYNNIKNRLDDIDSENVFELSNLDEKDSSEMDLNAGDEVRYYMSDDEENNAFISHNQENIEKDGFIRLTSKSDGQNFEIDKSEIIEIIPRNKSINQKVTDKLKKVKNDPDKLDKLETFLDEMMDDTNE